MIKKPLKNQQISEEAASWAVTLDAGALTTEEKRALAEWLQQSALHVDELLLAASLMAGLDDVDSEKTISIETLLTEVAPSVVPLQTTTVVPSSNINQPHKKKWQGFSFNQIAASFALLIIASAAFLGNMTEQPDQIAFATQTGEQRSITLADGSIIHVNTRSSIRVRYGETERVIEMLAGEALFEVAHDPERPFRVHTGTTIAEAVGTTFNVSSIDGQTKVAVVEGKVAVSSSQPALDTLGAVEEPNQAPIPLGQSSYRGQLLKAGELVSINENGQILAVTVPDMETITAWRMRKLVFKSDTLSTIAAEFNRYNREQIYLDDESVAAIEFSGVFAADDPHSFIKFLELSGTVAIDRPNRSTFRLTTPLQQLLQGQEKLL